MWTYKDKEFTEEDVVDYIGFVYIIYDKQSEMSYIGKKIFWNKKTRPPLKGKKRRRISKIPSNWQDYYGSNEALGLLVEDQGKQRFSREIIKLCNSKSEMSYFETKEIFKRDAILDPKYWNMWVSCRINQNQLQSIIPQP